MEQEKFLIENDSLEILILNYIFSNIKIGYYGQNGFASLEKLANNNISVKLNYKVTNEVEHKKVNILLVAKNTYTREECIKLAKEMYLKDENSAAFILKILNPKVNFK